ncbi:MAG: hypothetical protein IPM43_01880 [Actinomycetota bacterium]|nr:MAG: hypothetical protein IPM43_01880 [Actinomycetota bacterium]
MLNTTSLTAWQHMLDVLADGNWHTSSELVATHGGSRRPWKREMLRLAAREGVIEQITPNKLPNGHQPAALFRIPQP